jgi:hypothetical protein
MNAVADGVKAQANDSVSRWYRAATVRNAPRIFVPHDILKENVYPKARQLMATHPLIASRGEKSVSYILAQSTYKYMYEIGLLETRFVIDCALNIINNQIGQNTPEEDKLEAMTIVIDEGYHAYVALDFIIQLKANSAIAPLSIPQTNGNLDAVKRGYDALPQAMHGTFQLIATCLAEHTLTKDLLSIGKEKEATQTFTQVMTDHVSDEGRHANFFVRFLKQHWKTVAEEHKKTLGLLLPNYLRDYLAADWDREFDRSLLKALSLPANELEQVLADTQEHYQKRAQDYIDVTLKNLVAILERTGILAEGEVRTAFIAQGLLAQ